MRVARTHSHAERMAIRERPMNEIEAEIVQLQIFERLFAGGNHVLFFVLVVPQLRRDLQVFAADASLPRLLEGLPD